MTEFNDEDEIELFDSETGQLHFDLVMKLYKEDPEKLEEIQKNIVQKFIESAPEENQKKLKGLQFKIDAQRSLSKNPMQSYIKLSQLFWTEGFQKFQDVLNGDYNHPEPKGTGNNVVSIHRDHPESSI